jgi:hypothetical protein
MRAATQPVNSDKEANVAASTLGFGEDARFNFNRGRLGNLYVPPGFGDRSELNTEFTIASKTRT